MLALQLPDWNPLVRPHGRLTVERQVRRRKLTAEQVAARDGEDADPQYKGLKGEQSTMGTKTRTVQLSKFASEILQAYIDEGIQEGWLQRGGLLFPTATGAPRTTSFVSRKISEAVSAAGIGRTITAHYFRHTFVSNAIHSYTDRNMAVNWTLIGNVAGHTPAVAQKIYGHLEESAAVNEETAAFAAR